MPRRGDYGKQKQRSQRRENQQEDRPSSSFGARLGHHADPDQFRDQIPNHLRRNQNRLLIPKLPTEPLRQILLLEGRHRKRLTVHVHAKIGPKGSQDRPGVDQPSRLHETMDQDVCLKIVFGFPHGLAPMATARQHNPKRAILGITPPGFHPVFIKTYQVRCDPSSNQPINQPTHQPTLPCGIEPPCS